MTRLIEENLYWAIMHARWAVPGVWPAVREGLFAHVPGLMRGFVSSLARRAVTAQLKGHGMGRHSEAEVVRRGAADLQCLADALGEQPFYGGESPNAVDASAYAFIGSLLKQPFGGPLKTATESHANLAAYCGRVDERLFAG